MLPPSITITTDIFHPLVTPLTTYTYSTGSPSSDPVSASDEERLPPGGFSLRHGFPTWYGRAEKGPDASRGSSRNESSSQNGDENLVDVDTSARSSEHGHLSDHPEVITHIHPLKLNEYPNIVNALQYLKEAFDNETMIDDLPLEAAGNPSAWKAWRAHRRLVPESTDSRSKFDDPYDGDPSHSRASNPSRIGIQMQVKQPDEWNWDGVWKERVQKGVISSISDPVLYGNTGSSDGTVGISGNWIIDSELMNSQIRFAELEDDAIDAIKEKYFET